MMRSEQEILDLIVNTAKHDNRIRAVIMSGSRVNPCARRDIFQDFDIVYLVTEVNSFTDDCRWIDRFGELMIVQLPEAMGDPPPQNDGSFVYLMQFMDGNRIDLTLFPVAKLQELEMESCSLLLLDKDGIFETFPAPSEADYLPKPPSAKAFIEGHMSKRKASKKDKNRRDVRQALNRRLRQKAKKNFPDQKVIANYAQDGVKMSKVLEQFVSPYKAHGENPDAYRLLLHIASLAWNVALLPENVRQSNLDPIFVALPDAAREDMQELITELMKRKEEHFSQYRRMILELDITGSGDQWHLSVISTPDPV